MYEELFTHAYKIKRSQLGVGPSQKGLLLCDSFTGGHAASNGLDERRIRWAFANGVILPRRMPGGVERQGATLRSSVPLVQTQCPSPDGRSDGLRANILPFSVI